MSSCRHTAPLLSILRFNEIDERGERHVAHLEFCGACQAALVDDRALTRQLERALRARIEGAAASRAAWAALENRLVVAAPVRWQTRWTRWLRLPAGGLAGAGALSALALVLTLTGTGSALPPAGEPDALQEGSVAALPVGPASAVETPQTARVPAELFDAPRPPDLASVVMEAQYARAGKSPTGDAVLAAFLGKASPPSVDSLPDGYELVAYQPAADPE